MVKNLHNRFKKWLNSEIKIDLLILAWKTAKYTGIGQKSQKKHLALLGYKNIFTWKIALFQIDHLSNQ